MSARPVDRYAIGAVARRTGVSPALIRVWESRYEAVSPGRSDSGQRRYSEEDVRRLQLLKTLVDSGCRIGLVASLSDDELEAEVRTLNRPTVRLVDSRISAPLEEALEALAALDRERFRATLEQSSVRMGQVDVLDHFLTPLMREVGHRCASGEMRMVHEHLATAEVRGFLDGISGAFPTSSVAPLIVVGTPAWQYHELGALLVAAAARVEGWRVTYLGPNLPAAELAAAARGVSAAAVALSVTYVDDIEHVVGELTRLEGLLPVGVALLVGGAGAEEIRSELDGSRALHLGSLAELRVELERLRRARMAG